MSSNAIGSGTVAAFKSRHAQQPRPHAITAHPQPNAIKARPPKDLNSGWGRLSSCLMSVVVFRIALHGFQACLEALLANQAPHDLLRTRAHQLTLMNAG